MQITQINPQNNISHKAYFTNNTNFKRIVQYSAHKSFLAEDCINRLSRLPKHELTISDLVKKDGCFIAEVINNVTAQRREYTVSQSNPLGILVENLWKDSHIFYGYNASGYNKTINMLTKPE